MLPKEYESIIESILFVAGEAVSLKDLSFALEQDIKTTKTLVLNLKERCLREKRGILVIEINDSFQLCTNSEYFDYIKKLYQNIKKKPLSQTLLETLSIIAYKQPVTKADIENIRGVNADHAINKLMEFSLIRENGRLNFPGRPLLFVTTDEFLKHFGLSSLEELPTIESDFEKLKIEAEEEIEKNFKQISLDTI